MSINDIQTELDTIKNNKEMPLSSSIGYILKKNVESMEEFMNNKVINMYARPWNKLEPKLKRTKLNEYLTILMDKKEINLTQFNTLLYKLSKEIEFNKKITLDYDKDDCTIMSLNYESYL
jgi:predicted nucleic acid-binding protein